MRLLLQNLWWRLSDWLHRPHDAFMESNWLTRFKTKDDDR